MNASIQETTRNDMTDAYHQLEPSKSDATQKRRKRKGLDEYVRFLQANPHLLAGANLAPAERSLRVLIDPVDGEIRPIGLPLVDSPPLPTHLEDVQARIGPAQSRLAAPFWRSMLHHFERQADPSTDAVLSYRWRLAWPVANAPSHREIDLRVVPIMHQGAVENLFASVYVLQDHGVPSAPVVNPQVHHGRKRLYEEEQRLLALRARAFRLDQLRLGRKGFTAREMEILRLMHAGWISCQQLAGKLQRSPQTIRSHFKNVLRKGRSQWQFNFPDTRSLVRYMEDLHLFDG